MIKPMQKKLLFLLIILTAITTFILSLWDILYQNDWFASIMAAYGILFIGSILIFIIEKKIPTTKIEDTLKGDISHYKCPQCNYIFTLKKSKKNNHHSFAFVCPTCGTKGTISDHPTIVQEDIPDQKSMITTFICKRCGEWVSVWSQGKTTLKDLQIGTCPFCGKEGTMTS